MVYFRRMRILPRIYLPKRKAARRLWRKSKGYFTLRRIYFSVELVLFALIYCSFSQAID